MYSKLKGLLSSATVVVFSTCASIAAKVYCLHGNNSNIKTLLPSTDWSLLESLILTTLRAT